MEGDRSDLGASLPAQWKIYLQKNRELTYTHWPFTEGCACTPQAMAAAGFIHCPSENSPDVAKCFFCFKELDCWEPDDDPLTLIFGTAIIVCHVVSFESLRRYAINGSAWAVSFDLEFTPRASDLVTTENTIKKHLFQLPPPPSQMKPQKF